MADKKTVEVEVVQDVPARLSPKEKLDKNLPLTWQEKLEVKVPLSPLDEVRADADFNFRQRIREREEEANYKALKEAAGRTRKEAE